MRVEPISDFTYLNIFHRVQNPDNNPLHGDQDQGSRDRDGRPGTEADAGR